MGCKACKTVSCVWAAVTLSPLLNHLFLSFLVLCEIVVRILVLEITVMISYDKLHMSLVNIFYLKCTGQKTAEAYKHGPCYVCENLHSVQPYSIFELLRYELNTIITTKNEKIFDALQVLLPAAYIENVHRSSND